MGTTKYSDKLINFLTSCIAAMLFFSMGWFAKEEIKTNTEPIPKPIQVQQQPDYKRLNRENVLYWLNYFEVQHPEIVLSQSIQECGWHYESYRAQTYHNIFGLQQSDSNVLTFGHWIGSIIYYKKWQDTYYTGGDYLQFLEDYKYASDTLYTLKLTQITNLIALQDAAID